MRKGIYKDKKGRWYIHTTIKGRTITIRGFYSKKDADDNYDQAIEKWKRDHIESDSTSGYDLILNDYYSFRERQISKQSVDKIRTHFRTYWNRIFAGQQIKSVFSIPRLRILYDNVINDNELNDRKKYNVVRCFLDFANYCYLTKHINEELFKEVKVIFQPLKENKRVEKDKRYIPQSHVNALVSVVERANDKTFALAINVLYLGGLRISEMLALTGADIDLDNNKIKIRHQLLTTGEITDTLKTKNSYRDVPTARNLLNNLVLSANRLFNYSHTTFKRKLKQYEQQANIPTYSCHEFRHTFCTNLASKCTNISDVVYCSKIAGHTTSLFLDTYCKSLNNELETKFFG